MGTPVRMMCTLTETDLKLSGTCSGAQDGYTAHKVAGRVKAQTMEFHFQTAMQGNPIMLSLSGTLDEDHAKLDGYLDVEPMGVGGAFSAVRESADATPAAVAVQAPAAGAVQVPAAVAAEAPAAGAANTPVATEAMAAAGTQPMATGSWKINGDVQGVQVKMTCAIAEAEHKLTGTCTGAGDGTVARALTGESTEKGVAWRFDSVYEGNPITVSMSGTVAADGTKMSGWMAVAPMDVDGTFVAVKQ
jgi:acylphosphatase